MRVLALDTATEACSVALLIDGELRGRTEPMQRGHAEAVLRMVDALLAEAGMALTGLDGIAASIGPGSFTGVRISVAVAQGLAFGAGLAVVPVSTLEALALQALPEGAGHALACLDARMGEVYWGGFRADADRLLVACAGPAVGAPGTVLTGWARTFRPVGAGGGGGPPDPPEVGGGGGLRGIGRGFTAYPELQSLPGLVLRPFDGLALPDARDMARLGACRLRAGQGIDAADLIPLYVRDKVALTERERAAAAAAK